MRRVDAVVAAYVVFTMVTAVFGHDDAGRPHAHESAASALSSKHVRMTVRGEYRYIESDGIPEHTTGRFPNRGNPNSILPQKYNFRMPLHPQPEHRATPMHHQPFGVALNGVVFDPGTAEFWQDDPRSGWNYDALSGKINLGIDASNAHVQPSGAYHYHGIPTGLIQQLGGNKDKMLLIGYAADGFPIYASRCPSDAKDAQSKLKTMKSSYRLKKGMRAGGLGGNFDGTFVEDWEYVPQSGDLDECNGRSGVTPEYPDGTYYYVLTEDFPFIPRLYRGTPDESFERRGPGPRPGGRRPPPPRRG